MRKTTQAGKGLLYISLVAGFILAVAASFAIGYFWGGFKGTRDAYQSRFELDRELIVNVLRKDSAFANIEIHSDFHGYGQLTGEVATEEQYYSLRTLLIEAVGTKYTEHLIGAIRVRKRG